MADVSFTFTVDQWAKLQLALYMQSPGDFDEGVPVLLDRITSAPVLVSDKTGDNIKAMDDAELSALILAAKPANDAIIKARTTLWWRNTVARAKRIRNDYLSENASDPLDEGF